jgi:hypothetical protein
VDATRIKRRIQISELEAMRLKDWSKKLDEALWAYWTAHKTPIGMTPYEFIYGKSCHLPLELEHKEYLAIKEMNLDVDATRIKRRIQISE